MAHYFSDHYFQQWVDKEVKDPNYKLAVKIESIYGTSLWLMHAAIRANNPKLIKAAKNVFSGLFHIRGNNNYSIIELFDTYLMDSCKRKASELFSNLESNQGTNLTNEPFCAQANDSRHEILNKAGQNLFKGETVEVFRKSFTVVDDIAAVRANMFQYAGINDEKTHQHVPNYEPVVSQIRIGLRKSKYLLNPMENKELLSIENKELNPGLSDVFMTGVKSRDSDIRNVLRHNDIKLGYNSTHKLEILKADIGKTKDSKTKEIELKNEIKLMVLF